ncbi:hypothetical protein MMC26_005167 [Xylographa opegraphella]|nr:hypothetical protein [Xylographa opegraphella]
MSFFHTLKRRYRYALLNDERESGTLLKLQFSFSRIFCIDINASAFFTASTALLIVFCVALVSFSAGRRMSTKAQRPNLELNVVTQVFKYNRTFAEAPSDISDRAWKDIFPPRGGFFAHPGIAPHRSTFSVFHQLHCLDGIRQGYWTFYQMAAKGQKLQEEELPMMSSPPHVRHCIDLLRQSLMCHADTTVEVKEKGSDGVKGFGTTHHCRDWQQLLQWTSKAQLSTLKEDQ